MFLSGYDAISSDLCVPISIFPAFLLVRSTAVGTNRLLDVDVWGVFSYIKPDETGSVFGSIIRVRQSGDRNAGLGGRSWPLDILAWIRTAVDGPMGRT